MTPTLAILMTVTGLVLLFAVLLAVAGVSLLVVLLRESRKLDGAADIEKKLASVAGKYSQLVDSHDSLRELVAAKLNRIATTTKRRRKEQEEEEEVEQPDQNPDLFFPSLRGSN